MPAVFYPPFPWIVEKLQILWVVIFEINCDSLEVLLELVMSSLLLNTPSSSKDIDINGHYIVKSRRRGITRYLPAIRSSILIVKVDLGVGFVESI